MKTPVLRTIRQTMEIISKDDPETAFSEKALRALVAEGRIPCLQIGPKFLVDVNAVRKCMAGERLKQKTQKGTNDDQLRLW